MSRRISSLDKTTVGIDRDINSQYDNVKTVADNIGKVEAVAGSLAGITTVAGIQSEVVTLASISGAISSLYADKAILDSLFADKATLDSLFADKVTLDSLYADKATLDSLFADKATLDSLYTDKAALDRLHTSITNIDRVFSSIDNLDRVFTSIDNLDRVFDSIANLDRVYTSIDNIDAVFADITNIDTVASSIANVDIVAANDTNVTIVADNIVDVQNAEENATLAKEYAIQAEDTLGPNTLSYSALHYKEKSDDSAAAALASENKAQKWAEEAEDVEVEAGEYSAYHWAQKAEEYVANPSYESVTLLGGTGDQGKVLWNADEETLDLIQNGATLQLGQEVQYHVRNTSGALIANGTPVMTAGTLGASGRITVVPMDATVHGNTKYYLGIATEDIEDGTDGKVSWFGKIRGIDTSGGLSYGGLETWNDEDLLYTDPDHAGYLTNVEPTLYDVSYMPVAIVIDAHASAGTLFCKTNNINRNAYRTPILITENSNSAGRLFGGEVSDAGGGTVNITAGAGTIKTGGTTIDGDIGIPTDINEGQGSTTEIVQWGAQSGVALAGVGYNLIYWDASAEGFAVALKEDFYSVFNFVTDFTVGRVYYDGTTVTTRLCGMNHWNFDRRVQMFGEERFPVERASGLLLGETGERYLTVSAGTIWAELVNRFSIAAIDTSGADTFTAWYRDGVGGWIETAGSQVDNLNYDDGTGTLGTLIPQQYGVYWAYVTHDGSLHLVYGQDSYTLSNANIAEIPTTLPGLVGAYGTLVGKIIVQTSDTNLFSVQTSFNTSFSSAAVSEHNDLSSLQGGGVGEYYHLTSAEAGKLTDGSTSDADSLHTHNTFAINNQVIPEADFMARAAENRDKFAGSGFIEWGKHYGSGSGVKVADGLWTTALDGYQNEFLLGRSDSVASGVSKTDNPLVNINGVSLKIEGVQASSEINQNRVMLPPAPIATNLVTNGTFDTDTSGWSSAGDAASVNGALKITHSGTIYPWAKSNAIPVVAGRKYLVEMSVIEYGGAGGIRVDFDSNSLDQPGNVITQGTTSTGTFRTVIEAQATEDYYIGVYAWTDVVDEYVIVDNISVIDLGKVERQDLVFLESWHEKITDKDIVYPYGNTQSLLATDPATGLTTVAGSFTGYETYSLFGNWQASSGLIGKGLVWSALSDADRKKFVSDPENNVYLAKDGELVQVRYRIRVVEGPGVEWLGVNPAVPSVFNNNNVTKIKPKGKQTNIAIDLGDYNESLYGWYVSENHSEISYTSKLRNEGDAGIYHALRADTTTGTNYSVSGEYYGYGGLCQALPIALVSRRNQGAYHPVFNPCGASFPLSTINIPYGTSWYTPGAYELKSTWDAFGDGICQIERGSIASGYSGRPDSKYYDAIYESDILDLRNSAHKQDLTRTLEREFNKLVAGEMRGWENGSRTVLANQNPTSSGTTSRLNYTGIGSYSEVGDELVIIQSGVPYKAFVTVVATDYVDFDSRTYPAPAATGTGDIFCLSGLRGMETR